jgi:hypothetical protein
VNFIPSILVQWENHRGRREWQAPRWKPWGPANLPIRSLMEVFPPRSRATTFISEASYALAYSTYISQDTGTRKCINKYETMRGNFTFVWGVYSRSLIQYEIMTSLALCLHWLFHRQSISIAQLDKFWNTKILLLLITRSLRCIDSNVSSIQVLVVGSERKPNMNGWKHFETLLRIVL